jgi:SpoVK/Ycf46/Vps4 family AAA+-type ATPase
LFTVLLHGLITKYFGETATKLRSVFDAIRTTRGVYLFDEIDALAGDRARGNDVGEARRVLNSFLQFLEEDPGPSLIVATTNLPELLDSAILRRFDLVIRYELPSAEAVVDTVRRRLRGFAVSGVDWNRVATEGVGFSPADLIRATEDAARRIVLAGADELHTDDLLKAFERRRSLQLIGDGTSGTPTHRSARTGRSRTVSSGRKRPRTTA